MYDESFAAADQLRGDGTPAENIEAMIRALFSAWDKHEHLFRALPRRPRDQHDRARAVGQRPGVVRAPWSRT